MDFGLSTFKTSPESNHGTSDINYEPLSGNTVNDSWEMIKMTPVHYRPKQTIRLVLRRNFPWNASLSFHSLNSISTHLNYFLSYFQYPLYRFRWRFRSNRRRNFRISGWSGWVRLGFVWAAVGADLGMVHRVLPGFHDSQEFVGRCGLVCPPQAHIRPRKMLQTKDSLLVPIGILISHFEVLLVFEYT